MKQEDWLWILGGLGLFLLLKNQQPPATQVNTQTASLNTLPVEMISTGIFGGATMVVSGLAGMPPERNFGTGHRSRYRYQ